MFLSISVPGPDATDLGFVLQKHPESVFRSEVSFGRVTGFYPRADADGCEFALVVEVDHVERVRGVSWDAGSAGYIDPHPYAASSYLATAIPAALRSALNGKPARGPDEAAAARMAGLAARDWDLAVRVCPVPASERAVAELFGPVGFEVETKALRSGHPMASPMLDVVLRGKMPVSRALSALYVLLPVTDGKKHYFYTEQEAEKLLSKGEGWLAVHPRREAIVQRYLGRSRQIAAAASERLGNAPKAGEVQPEKVPGPWSGSHALRHEAILRILGERGSRRIVDLGCSEGSLLEMICSMPLVEEAVGVDPSLSDLERAGKRCGPKGRVLQGSAIYVDSRLRGFDTVVMCEMIEHVDPSRVELVERAVFGTMRPDTVILTTPNRSFNEAFGLPPGSFRHQDHRFEWTSTECSGWARRVAAQFGYSVEVTGVGGDHPEHGSISTLCVFTKDGR